MSMCKQQTNIPEVVPTNVFKDVNISVFMLIAGYIGTIKISKQLIPTSIIQLIIKFYNFSIVAVGCNERGDLGKGDDDNMNKPNELSWTRGLGITKIISCSYKSFCFITSTSDIYVSGCNDWGQLGLNHEEDQWTAKKHPFFSNKKLKIVSVSRSVIAFHVFFLCSNGEIYCCGSNEYGQLGLNHEDDQENYITPQENQFFNSKNNINIISIACGEYHTLFLSSDGEVYSCGLNESFQLGYKTDSDHQKTPKKITQLQATIKSISCGRDHSYCLSEHGLVYSFGSNYRGQLGVNKSESQQIETIHKIAWFEQHEKQITNISSGNYHGAAIDASGNVFVWGRGDEGQIGNGKKSDKFEPTQVDALNNEKIIEIACGCHHICCLTEKYKVYCWGNNRYNQCSQYYMDGGHTPITKPTEYYNHCVNCFAGSYHTLFKGL